MKKVTDLLENEGIVCRNEQEAKGIMRLMHAAGLKWCTGDSYIDDYMSYNEIVYVPFRGTHLILESAIYKGYTIHEAKDFLVEENINVTGKLFNHLLSKYNIDLNLSELNEIIDLIKEQNTITLPLVNGVPDVTNCGVEMLVSDDGVNWSKAIVYSYNEKHNFPYLSNIYCCKHAKPLPKKITKKEAEKLLNNEFEIID